MFDAMQGRRHAASAISPARSTAIAQDMRLPRRRSQELREYAADVVRGVAVGVVPRLLLLGA